MRHDLMIFACCLLGATAWVAAPGYALGQEVHGPETVPAQPTSLPRGGEEARRPQLLAAMTDALQGLRRDVLRAPVAGELTVAQLLDRIGGADKLYARLQNAQQRGGTRWRDDRDGPDGDVIQTCEIMMEIPGLDVADTLAAVINEQGGELGVPSDELRRGLDGLRGRTFAAVGVGSSPKSLDHLHPDDPAGPWRVVGKAARKAALETARANAVAQVIESLRPMDLTGGKRMDDALAVPGVDAALRQWVASRPLTGVQFGDDLVVKLTLSAPGEELWPEVWTVLRQYKLGPGDDDGPGWNHLQRAIERDTAPAVGRAAAVADKPDVVPAPAAPGGVAAAVVARPPVGVQPPAWVVRQVDAVGAAPGTGLPGARAAEAVALTNLRADIEKLPLAGGRTVGGVAKDDPRVAQAVDRAVRRAALARVDYFPTSAKARVALSLDQLWRDIADVP